MKMNQTIVVTFSQHEDDNGVKYNEVKSVSQDIDFEVSNRWDTGDKSREMTPEELSVTFQSHMLAFERKFAQLEGEK